MLCNQRIDAVILRFPSDDARCIKERRLHISKNEYSSRFIMHIYDDFYSYLDRDRNTLARGKVITIFPGGCIV